MQDPTRSELGYQYTVLGAHMACIEFHQRLLRIDGDIRWNFLIGRFCFSIFIANTGPFSELRYALDSSRWELSNEYKIVFPTSVFVKWNVKIFFIGFGLKKLMGPKVPMNLLGVKFFLSVSFDGPWAQCAAYWIWAFESQSLIPLLGTILLDHWKFGYFSNISGTTLTHALISNIVARTHVCSTKVRH